MGQKSHTATVPHTNQESQSGTLLIKVGILWLLLAAALSIYQLIDPTRVEITWETAAEQRTVGFNVYRSSESDEGFVLINEDQFIDSQGGPVSGANYSFIDDSVEAGKTYYYILEEVEFDGSQNRYADEVFEYSVPLITWWAIGLTACSAIIGLAMLLSGLSLKEKNQ